MVADIDHLITSSHGCQKHLDKFYCLCRIEIRGDGELWNLQRNDLKIEVDKSGQDQSLSGIVVSICLRVIDNCFIVS